MEIWLKIKFWYEIDSETNFTAVQLEWNFETTIY